jgi:alkanesulfonate monooxygenase SsuD/methylene tetrahydromethanopterin reductase-like flavin-dependent oxidoreductase (luciferase family)
MREYVDVVRIAWDYLRTEEPATYTGKHYRFQSMPLNPWGIRTLARDRIPIILAATGPKMISLAGETADGVLGYSYTAKYLEDQVLPNLTASLQRADRRRSDVEIISYVICSVSDDPEIAWRRARIHVGTYFAHPTSDAFLALHGLDKDIIPVREGLMQGGLATLVHTVSDALVEAFSITGTPAEVHAKLRRFDGLLDHVILHTPYVPPLTHEETKDAFHSIVSAFSTAELAAN